MRFIYQQWDGSEFPTQEHLEHFSNFLEYVMEYGEGALQALRELSDDPEQRKIIDQWVKDGLLDKVGVHFRLTPRAINSLQRKALMEVFRDMKADASEGHETRETGRGGERIEETRAYQFGDPMSDVDLNATMRNALHRSATHDRSTPQNRPESRSPAPDGQPAGKDPRATHAESGTRHRRGIEWPLRLQESDFELHQTESAATCSTVILLDMSGSMSRWGRFVQAKKCAMAMHALIRQRFALDTVDVVGFFSGAEVISEGRLPLVLPKRISMFDPQIRLCVPIAKLPDAPQHFTNLHMGLITARRILARRGGVNKQVFIITDGQPTAHVQGEYVHLIYPAEDATAMATLSEAILLARQGIRFSTFALIEDYYYMDWVNFVDHLTKLTRGVAFYCTSGDLTNCVMESYLSGRKTKAFLT